MEDDGRKQQVCKQHDDSVFSPYQGHWKDTGTVLSVDEMLMEGFQE